MPTSGPSAHHTPGAGPTGEGTSAPPGTRPEEATIEALGPQPAYAELAVTSNFSFLRGASHPEELVERAAALGHVAAAIADHHTLAGVVRAHVAAKRCHLPLVVGSRLRFSRNSSWAGPSWARSQVSGPRAALEVLVFPTGVASYARLSRLLTLGKRRAPKGKCHLQTRDLEEAQEGILAVVLPSLPLTRQFLRDLAWLRGVFDDDRLSLASSCLFGEDDRGRLETLSALARRTRIPLVATNDVHYHAPERRPLQDILTCIREGVTIETAGFRLFPHAERHLKTGREMARLFHGHESALARAVEVARRAGAFSLDQLRFRYPEEPVPEGRTAIEHLRHLVEEGARSRYLAAVPPPVRERLERELSLIEELDYAAYFLTVHDIVSFARSRQILCQGRGAAANSAVCYCLGITALDPERIDMLFERFVSRARNEPPDIDVDFEHQRREEVIQYIYRRYGRERAALCAEVISYRHRSAVRDVGKALGLALDTVDQLTRGLSHWGSGPIDLSGAGVDGREPEISLLQRLAEELVGFPRHLSQHVGGMVMTQDRLCDLVPIENAAMPERTVIEWDKDDLDAMKILKVDVLALGMLTCIRQAFEKIQARGAVNVAGGDLQSTCPGGMRGGGLSWDTIPSEDPAVYDMLCAADTVGVFQVESRAQMAMLPRLKPRCFYDLVIEVAIVRPGPIQGRMVHPYLRRREGKESVDHPSGEIERVLKKTLGVPLFQEQAMSLAMVGAGFSAEEAEELRRSMAAWKRRSKDILRLGSKLVEGMVARGLPRSFAERCFAQIQGFSEYGFPEAHAASFALLVYTSAWLKHHHPAAFAAALLDSQPMGFYAPAQIVRDARAHGVDVRPVDVNHSGWECRLEETGVPARPALRLGMRLVKGLSRRSGEAIAGAVSEQGFFCRLEDLWGVKGVGVSALRRLAAADAFGSLGLSRQKALWQARALREGEFPLLGPRAGEGEEKTSPLPVPSAASEVARDYGSVSLSLKAHPVSFLRENLAARGVLPAAALADVSLAPHGHEVAVAGAVLCRQRPVTAKGILFVTVEDETGSANLIVWPSVFERFRNVVLRATFLLARGRIERSGRVVHLLVRQLENLTSPFATPALRSRDFH